MNLQKLWYKICSILFRPAAVGPVLGAEWRTTTRFCKSEGFGMPTIAKQSYKQNYTAFVELSIFNCGHEYCQPGQTWGPGVREHYLNHLVGAG